MINIEDAFNTENRSVYEYFQSPGVGFYIPLYQREYSWDLDNIDQLLQDIAKGIENVTEGVKDEIRFLGTIITVTYRDKTKISPQDTKALPSSVQKVIDGQQRLSTLALISGLLHWHIRKIEEKFNKSLKKSLISDASQIQISEEIAESCTFWKEKLLAIFSVDLMRGKPTRKPKIIRGSQDKWVMQEENNQSYNSPVAKYLYETIENIYSKKDFPKFEKENNVGKNLREVDNWIKKSVLNAHINRNGFCSATDILKHFDQEYIWQYDRPNLEELINENDFEDSNSLSFITCSIVQLFAVCHYLLDRCCFTIIQPMDDDWAFDMFQSLNATGTPLTSIETFKPIVVSMLEREKREFKNSLEDKYFTKIESAFGDQKTAAQKSKFTNDLLTSFALPTDGTKLATHFSSQRKWLERIYEVGLGNDKDRLDFIRHFGNYSEFYSEIWNKYRGENNQSIYQISGSRDSEIASLLLLYLVESNHRMAITLLAPFYSEVVEGKENSISNFIKVIKLISAFYTIWRSCKSNSGLDDVYRNYFRGHQKIKNAPVNWLKNRKFDYEDIKNYLIEILKNDSEGDLTDKNTWQEIAKSYLSYDNAYNVCKFSLFIGAHDTIPDGTNPGLMKRGTDNSNPFLTLKNWTSPELKTIEHIAPEKQSNGWPDNIYSSKLVNSIGNLTLLPLKVNISASNRGWKDKLIYYRFLSEKDPEKIQELEIKAKNEGLELNPSTISLLKNSQFNSHIEHILLLGENQEWDDSIIQKRAHRITHILWDRISSWIFI